MTALSLSLSLSQIINYQLIPGFFAALRLTAKKSKGRFRTCPYGKSFKIQKLKLPL
jgi:hypothetical protein